MDIALAHLLAHLHATGVHHHLLAQLQQLEALGVTAVTKRRPPADPPRVDYVPGQLDLDGQEQPSRVAKVTARTAHAGIFRRLITRAGHRGVFLERTNTGVNLRVDTRVELDADEERAVRALLPGIHTVQRRP